MSIVSEVLASLKHKGSAEGSLSELDELVKKSDEMKFHVCQTLSTRYSSLTTTLHDVSQLQQKVHTNLNDLQLLQSNIENEVTSNMKNSSGEITTIIKQWQEAVAGLEFTTVLLKIHNLLKQEYQARLEIDFLTSAGNLNEVEQLLNDPSNHLIGQLDLISTLKKEFCNRKMQLLYSIGEVWNETISWEKEKLDKDSNIISLLIKVNDKDEQEMMKLKEILPAFHLSGELDKHLTTFGKNLMNNWFKPMMKKKSKVKIISRPDGVGVEVKFSNDESYNPLVVMGNVSMILEFFCQNIFKASVTLNNDKVKIISLLGEKISEPFLKCFIEDNLINAVPHSRSNLQEFDTIKLHAAEFNKKLVDIGFLSPLNTTITDFTSNIDTVFCHKSCAHILEEARKLMHQPLHLTVLISPLQDSQQVVILDEAGNELKESSLKLEKLLSVKTFCLTKCKISGSICKIVELIYSTLEEACTSSPEHARRLWETVRNILTMYCDIVPTAHKEALATLPQQAALVHNNCMYLSHHALLLGHFYNPRLPSPLKDLPITTSDLGQNLRSCSTIIFLKALQNHKAQLIETLRETVCGSSLNYESESNNKAEKGVRQCLHQLQLLHNLWQDVLPTVVYTKSIGTLVSSVIEELITRVVALEDISTNSAQMYSHIFTLIKEAVPKLFQIDGADDINPEEVVLKVKRWTKFSELILVLRASLKDILARWADGKGPLAHEFTADELKQLIRALFQNTDRRAEVLAKIK